MNANKSKVVFLFSQVSFVRLAGNANFVNHCGRINKNIFICVHLWTIKFFSLEIIEGV